MEDSTLATRHVVIITRDESNLLDYIQTINPSIQVISPEEIIATDLTVFDSIAILGGTSESPILFTADQRAPIENEIAKGKRVFAEYVASIGHVYSEQPELTRFKRLVYCSDDLADWGWEAGVLLDDQCGQRIKPHDITCVHTTPILQYTTIHAHDRINYSDVDLSKVNDRALWFDNPSNLLVCSFRLANFGVARYAPKERITNIIEFIIQWLFEGEPSQTPQYHYKNGTPIPEQDFDAQIKLSVNKAIDWLTHIVSENGNKGVFEGYATDIFANGQQKFNAVRRADCIGEVSLALLLHDQWNKKTEFESVVLNLQQFMYKNYVSREDDIYYGMMRWTDEAWGVCYQDDVARAIIPTMLHFIYTGNNQHVEDIEAILQFLIQTTGNDGTRAFRTDNKDLNETRILELHNEPGNLASAHYNAYYYAALCLAYGITRNRQFLDVAISGIDTLMSIYPNTVREQSETQEYCRLILPLSWMYSATGDSKYKNWLYQVTHDLQRFKHSSGGYLEWDTGYTAAMRHAVGEGESSLLAQNGDPVVDLLYSNNWLPVAFIQAYFATDDLYFYDLWKESSQFMIQAQIHSSDQQIDGAWARAFDVEKQEVFGSPADFGWGPWAIESGWTVAEIASGLMMGMMSEELKVVHQNIFH